MVEQEYKIFITKQGLKDKEKIIKIPALKNNVDQLIQLIKINPFATPPFYETLVGELKGAYSRRINRQHRLIYKVDEKEKVVTIIRMWTHYE